MIIGSRARCGTTDGDLANPGSDDVDPTRVARLEAIWIRRVVGCRARCRIEDDEPVDPDETDPSRVASLRRLEVEAVEAIAVAECIVELGRREDVDDGEAAVRCQPRRSGRENVPMAQGRAS